MCLLALLKRENGWYWSDKDDREFGDFKREILSVPILAPFTMDPNTWLSTDVSSYGPGAASFQRHCVNWKPVAFASRAMSETEERYVQIEKEALAIC